MLERGEIDFELHYKMKPKRWAYSDRSKTANGATEYFGAVGQDEMSVYSFPVYVEFDSRDGEISRFTEDVSVSDLSNLSSLESRVVIHNLGSFWMDHVGVSRRGVQVRAGKKLYVSKEFLNASLSVYYEKRRIDLFVNEDGIISTAWPKLD